MSRSDYTDDHDQWSIIRWRGAVASAIRGKRGQAFLMEMLAALDAIPDKCLTADELQDRSGSVCAIGAVGAVRGINMKNIDSEDSAHIASVFGISEALAREVLYENDEVAESQTPEQRFARMRRWVVANIKEPAK